MAICSATIRWLGTPRGSRRWRAAAWSGVGRLNIAGNRFCTATMISDRHVITAAHCLYNPRTKSRVEISEMRFVAGLRRGDYAAVRRIAAAATLPDYTYDSTATMARIASDVALLELETPIDVVTFPALDARVSDRPMTLVSYARDRAYAPSIEHGCETVRTQGVVFALTCDVTFGASGAPVFAMVAGRPRVVALVSAMGRVGEEKVALAVSVNHALSELAATLARDAARPPRSIAVARVD
ncbi:MAG: trypsin [Alphaproteobacteria bacterium HGW-Alphaproteobacteria-8]|nr:MAG: trypsin [Alphaproteobacteria bacterium HGW-Alphaproteobacteria-8]